MRFLSVTALCPPNIIGGAEVSAWNLAKWLGGQPGIESCLITTATEKKEEFSDKMIEGVRVWSVYMPRPYPILHFPRAKTWKKPIWHFQDHFDPRNRGIMGKVLDASVPDFVNIHNIQGFGYNALAEIAVRKIPSVYFLHDLGLACIKMSMYKDGKTCSMQCQLCHLSTKYKASIVNQFDKIGFCSPSWANLNSVAEYFPIKNRKHTSILNPNKYDMPTSKRTKSEKIRFIFVGRVHTTKGVDILLMAADSLADNYDFSMTIVGDGPSAPELREKYGNKAWCEFTGHVSAAEVTNRINVSDVLCAPSVWLENSPGVVIEALSQGIPAIGSRVGGIPELIDDGVTGMLIEPGNLDAWRQALESILANPSKLDQWKKHSQSKAKEFDQDFLGNKYIEFAKSILV